MKALKTLIVFLIMMSMAIRSYPQGTYGHIDSVKMIPEIPTMSDTIKIIIYNSFPSGGCSNKQRYYTENLPDINNLSKYCIGPYAFPCNDQDTLRISPLSPGSYNLHYKIETAYNLLGCDPYYPADSIDFQFYVNYPVIIENLFGVIKIFKISYDQNHKKLLIYLNQDLENYSIVIQNMLGNEIFRSRLNNLKNQIYINWEDGTYLVTVFNDKRKQTQKILIKNNH